MSCAEWPRLESWAARRLERRAGEGPAAETAAAAEHLAACADCRRRAYALDPALLFLELRRSDGAVGPAEITEIDTMRERVAAMRAIRWPGEVGRRARAGGWRWAAAALLLAAGLVEGERPPGLGSLPIDLAARAAGPAATAPSDLELQPVVEEIGRPEARVYQFAGDDLSIVMIVDETLDV